MSQYYPYIFEYDPFLFGHPHDLAEPQFTEPFWQQYPSWTQAHQPPSSQIYPTTFYDPRFLTTMDSETVYIGKNTRNGHKKMNSGNGPNHGGKGKAPHNQTLKPKGKVDVYIDDAFIQDMPLGTLVRFSKTAAAAFPKPGPVKEVETGKGAETTPHDWAEDEEKSVDVEKLTAEVGKLNTSSNAAKASTSKAAEKSAANTVDEATTKHSNKELNLNLDTLWFQPSVEAFDFVFKWMHMAKNARPGEQPLDYGVPQPEKLSLEKLFDMYAAALCLDLRPFPHKHRHDLMTRVTEKKILLADLQYVHEHLPVDDPVMTRLITSFYENKDARNSYYVKAEIDLIEQYVCEVDPQLCSRFKEIGDARQEKTQARRRRKGENRMQQLAEGLEASEFAEAPTVNGENRPEEKVGGPAGRRRNRRKAGNKGKDSKGNSVPGVSV